MGVRDDPRDQPPSTPAYSAILSNDDAAGTSCRVEEDEIVWVVLVGLVGWTLGILFVVILCHMAAYQDRAARHAEKKLIPFSDVTITRPGG